MRLGIGLVDKVHIVGANELYAQFLRELFQHGIHLLLQGERLVVGACHSGLVPLQFKVEIVAKHALEPLRRLSSLVDLPVKYQLGYLAAKACRTHHEPLVVTLKLLLVGSRV